MVGTPNIKITTSMIDEFQSPFKDNPNTYIKISQDGLAQYLTPDEVAQDIGGGSGGENTSTIWTPGVTYRVGDIVSYNNSLFQCRQEHVAQEPFDFNKWQLLAGYFKTSKFFYDPVNEITSVVLDDAVANKESLSVNINNLLLQSNNYTLADDGKTLTFNEPIEPGTNIEVIVYGNMIIPTNVSQVVSKSFTTTEESTTEFPLGEKVLKKDLITVNIENSVIMNSEWDLNETLDTVILKNAVPVGTRVQLSWFNNLEVQVSATYTPHINKVDRDTTLSWTNDDGLENPADSHIYDGVTFVPSQSKTGTETTLSWTNNGNLDNPENVVIKDGTTFTPSQTKVGLDTTLSWTNDVGLPNPENVIISDGVTYTPHTTQDAHEATISFTNNKELENPETISIYTNYAQRIVESFTATENQTTFVASHEIYDKSVLSVNVGNTELTAAAYSLGADKKTVTLVNGLSAGTLVDLKYFYNLNIGTEGITFTPELTPIDNGYTLSWTNDGGLDNPTPVNITSGSGINPKGDWSAETAYIKSDYVTYEDTTAQYGYLGLKDNIPAGTALTDTSSWMEMYKILKTYTDTNQQVLSNDGTNLSWRNEQVGYNQITNCITEIPQDIKLEINNGTITLKAGSKVYNGNGIMKTTTTDITSANANYDGQVMLALSKDFDVLLTGFVPGESVSELPTSTASFKIYYNTTDKKCYLDTTDGWQECSLPIALGTSTVSSWVSIDQVFNGFGFVGSTIFALPEVKGLSPNGNDSLTGIKKNNIISIENILTYTCPNITANVILDLYANKIAINSQAFDKPTTDLIFFDEINNYNYAGLGISNDIWVGSARIENGKIVLFNPKHPISLVDKNDSSWVAQQAMPSKKYINLELGISGTVYTAVANGYIQLVKQATAANQYLVAYDTNLPSTVVDENTIAIKWSTSGVNDVLYFPVRKGQQFIIGYTFGGQTIAFRLIFAQGE